MEPFISTVSEDELKRERAKSRDLRKTTWWKRRVAEGVCYYCNRRFCPEELTMDHIVPLVRGGKAVKGNVAVCCKECNTRKKYLLPMEWDEYLKRLRTEED